VEPSGGRQRVKDFRQTISDEYKNTISDHHHSKIWGASAVKWSGPSLTQLLGWTRYNIQTALDYGGGQHVIADEFPEIAWVGYDPGIPERENKPNHTFDLVFCSDVMEHIEEEFVVPVLQEIVDYAEQCVLLNIACSPALDVFKSGPRQGQDVHVTVKSPAWWHERCKELEGVHIQEVHALGRQVRGTWRERVKILIEIPGGRKGKTPREIAKGL
jgi:hypothetical protein